MFDDALLPSPNQLKYKILIKNKKIPKQTNTNASASGLANTATTGMSTSQADCKLPANMVNSSQSGAQVSTSNPTPKAQLSQNSKSSIWPLNNLAYNKAQSNDVNDFSTVYNDDNNESELICQEQAAAAASGSISIASGMVKRIKTRLSAEPKIKKNVVNFIHKSKSLTDSAFNKLSGNTNNRSRVSNSSNVSQSKTVESENNRENNVQINANTNDTSSINNQQPVLNLTSSKKQVDSIDSNYLNRIKKR